MKKLKNNFHLLVLIMFLVGGLFLLDVSYIKAVGAAYFPQDTTINLTIGGVSTNFTVVGGSDADQVTTATSTVTVLISAGQRFTLKSLDKKVLNNDGNFTYSCQDTQSIIDITLSSGASQKTVVITPDSGNCAGSTGGGSVGFASPASSIPSSTPKPTSSPTATPRASLTPTPTPAATPVVAQLPGASTTKLYRRSGDNKIYVKQASGLLKWVKTLEEFNSAGYNWANIKVLPAKTFNKFKIDVSPNAPVLVAPAATPIPASNHIKIKSGIKFLNIRNSNSIKGKIIGRALVGQKFEFTDFKDGWYKIQKDGKDLGWISGNYVSKF